MLSMTPSKISIKKWARSFVELNRMQDVVNNFLKLYVATNAQSEIEDATANLRQFIDRQVSMS